VPGVRYVIDTGTARISRYSARLEGRATADRADLVGLGRPAMGRCGRVAPGVGIRLYSEDDYLGP